MVKIWYRDSDETDIHCLHQPDQPIFLEPEELYKRTGVQYTQVADNICSNEEELMSLRVKLGYNHYDWLEIKPDSSTEHQNKMAGFYKEHLHEDPEIRLIVGGGGYFEVRDIEDKWIRIHVTRGDLLDLPPGIYHRFTLDNQQYIKMLRLFSEIPKWSAVNRCEVKDHSARHRYEEFIKTKVTA